MVSPRILVILWSAAAILLLTAACGQDAPVRQNGVSSEDITTAARLAAQSVNRDSGSSQQGILVTGTGTATAEPDLAVINLGVQVLADSAGMALEGANTSLSSMLAVFATYGIEEGDTQTRFFNISTQYNYKEDGERVVAGYQVSNQLSAKVRNLDTIGDLITDIVEAGGNAVQVNGINFAIEDTSALQEEALMAAVEAAKAQAEKMAELSGVSVGKLMQISQTRSSTPVASADFAESMAMPAAMARSTPVQGGSLDVTVYVQALLP